MYMQIGPASGPSHSHYGDLKDAACLKKGIDKTLIWELLKPIQKGSRHDWHDG